MFRFIALALGLLLPMAASAADVRTICVYDPAGKTGDYYSLMTQYATAMSDAAVELQLKPYTDEETAAKDYEAGQCDGVVATGVRLQRFNRFPSTIEAMGAVPNYDILKQMVTSLATYPSAAVRLKADDNETVGFIPVGAVYLFVRDRNVDSVSELAGKRIATLSYDKASPVMVDRVGAIVVDADLGSIGPKFNNGDVDACYVSAAGYRPFELWRGLEPNGGVLKAPLAQATLQVMIRSSKFPAGFAAKSRTDLAGRFDSALAVVKKAEADIPAKYWVDMPADTIKAWDDLFLAVRIKLRDDVKAYDPNMLTALRKLRCNADATRAECAEQKE
jgi:hypothetical protein